MCEFISICLGLLCAVLVIIIIFLLKSLRNNKSNLQEVTQELYKSKKETQSRINDIIYLKGLVKIAEEKSKTLSVQYFAETEILKKFFSDKNIIRYKMQLFVDNLPVGNSSIVKQDIYKEVDKEQVNKVLEDFAKPLLDIGIKTTTIALNA